MSFLQTLGNLIWAVGVDQPRFQGNTPYYELEEIYGASYTWTADQMATLFRLSLLDSKLQLGEDLMSVFVEARRIIVRKDGSLLEPNHEKSMLRSLGRHWDLRQIAKSIKNQKRNGTQSCRR